MYIDYAPGSQIYWGHLGPLVRFEQNLIPDNLSLSGASTSLADTESQLPAWAEPKTLEELTNTYNVENKIAGRTAGSTLYLVQSKGRDGQVRECADPNQQFKLFLVHALCAERFVYGTSSSLINLYVSTFSIAVGVSSQVQDGMIPKVAHTPLAIPIKEFQLAHGSAKFQKADKIAALKREGKTGGDITVFQNLTYLTSSASKQRVLTSITSFKESLESMLPEFRIKLENSSYRVFLTFVVFLARDSWKIPHGALCRSSCWSWVFAGLVVSGFKSA